MEHNDEFGRYMETAKNLVPSLAAATEKSRAYAWLQYLQGSANSKLRMDYIKLLVFSLQKNKLLGIFTDDPPVEIQIPPFPGGVTLATMKDYISALAAAGHGSGDSNLRSGNTAKNVIALNIIPEDREIYCYMLHGGNESGNSRGKSCSCGSNRRRAVSPPRKTRQQAVPPDSMLWDSDASGQYYYDLGEQDPWFQYVYLEQRNDPKGKMVVIDHMDDKDVSSYEEPNVSAHSGVPDDAWMPAEERINQSFGEYQPSDASNDQRGASSFGFGGGARFQSFPPRDFQPPSPQQMSPRSPRRSPQTPRFSPQQGGVQFSPQRPPIFSPQYMSTPSTGSPARTRQWADDSSFFGNERPQLNQPQPVRPKSRWGYSQLDNYAPPGYYPQSPELLSQTHPQMRRPMLKERRDFLIRNMPDFRNDEMRGTDQYDTSADDVYNYYGYQADPSPSTPPQMPPRLPTVSETPRRNVKTSPPRNLNMGMSPPRPCQMPPPMPSPVQRAWGGSPPRRSPSPGARRSPSPARNWEQQVSYGDYTTTTVDPRSFMSDRSGMSSIPASPPPRQASPDGGRRLSRPPLFIHDCKCSCGSQPHQMISRSHDTTEEPSAQYNDMSSWTGQSPGEDASPKQDSDDAVGKGRHLDKSNPGSEHSVWEESQSRHDNTTVPLQISGGDVNVQQQKPTCRCNAKGEHYQGH